MIDVVPLEPFGRWRTDVAAVFQAAYAAEAQLLGVEVFPPLTRVLTDREAGEFLGVLDEGTLVAVLEVESKVESEAESEASPDATLIASLAVLPDRFRQGLASALLDALLATRSGPFLVSTAVANTAALALYHRYGFVETARVASPEGLELIELRR